MKRGWQKYLLYASVVIVGGFILFETVRLKNTGFEGKSLWDWMELLIIPLVLALGAFYLNRSEKELERKSAEDRAKLDRELAVDRQKEEAFQAYLDRMAELLLKENLRTTDNEEVPHIARTLTLTVLRRLSPKRKGNVIIFLYDAKLITDGETIVSLMDADLSDADLEDAYLEKANLKGVIMDHANLAYAVLNHAN